MNIEDHILPRVPWRVTSVEVLSGLRLRVTFADGLEGTVDLSRMVYSPRAGVFADLADSTFFTQVRIDCGTVTWPGGLDLAPDTMHAAILMHGEWILEA
jgi:hypothetical protein